MIYFDFTREPESFYGKSIVLHNQQSNKEERWNVGSGVTIRLYDSDFHKSQYDYRTLEKLEIRALFYCNGQQVKELFPDAEIVDPGPFNQFSHGREYVVISFG